MEFRLFINFVEKLVAMLIGLDLDDTLYKECEYVASGRRAVAAAVPCLEADALKVMAEGEDAFDALADFLRSRGVQDWPVSRMVDVYRNHTPVLKPDPRLIATLQQLRQAGHKVVIITDGNFTRQRAKIRALGLEKAVDAVYVSEQVGGDKITGRGFEAAVADFPDQRRIYIGDNPAKDFDFPRRNGWYTVMLADTQGVNIHPAVGGCPAHTVIFDIIPFLKTLNPFTR